MTPKIEEDELDEDDGLPLHFRMGDGETEESYNFEDFKHLIDHRGGYLNGVAINTEDIEDDIQEILDEECQYSLAREQVIGEMGYSVPLDNRNDDFEYMQYVQANVAPENTEQWHSQNPYSKKH
jgi:hypothetical protein